MQTALMILAALVGALAVPVVAGAIYQAIGTWRDRRRFPPAGRLVRVNERQMHIHVTGEGTPTVLFESGMGASCLSWTLVQPQVAQFTRAVSYDRAGHGWSDPAVRQPNPKDDQSRRSIEEIPPEEVALAMRNLVRDSLSIERDKLLLLIARLFGFERAGNHIQKTLAKTFDDLVEDGQLIFLEDRVSLPN